MSARRKARQQEAHPPNRVRRIQREYMEYPPVKGLVWTEHARKRFAERVTDAVEPDVLHEYVTRRVPNVNPRYKGPITGGRTNRGDSPFVLDVQDVCRLVLDWKSNMHPDNPDYWQRGVWVVVTVYDWADRFVMRSTW